MPSDGNSVRLICQTPKALWRALLPLSWICSFVRNPKEISGGVEWKFRADWALHSMLLESCHPSPLQIYHLFRKYCQAVGYWTSSSSCYITVLCPCRAALEAERSWDTFPYHRFWTSRNPYTNRHLGLRAQILARVSVDRHPQRLFDAPSAGQRDGREELEEDWSTEFLALILRRSFGRVVLSIPAVLSRQLFCLADQPIQGTCASPLLLIVALFRRGLLIPDLNWLFDFSPKPSLAWPVEVEAKRFDELLSLL